MQGGKSTRAEPLLLTGRDASPDLREHQHMATAIAGQRPPFAQDGHSGKLVLSTIRTLHGHSAPILPLVVLPLVGPSRHDDLDAVAHDGSAAVGRSFRARLFQAAVAFRIGQLCPYRSCARAHSHPGQKTKGQRPAPTPHHDGAGDATRLTALRGRFRVLNSHTQSNGKEGQIVTPRPPRRITVRHQPYHFLDAR